MTRDISNNKISHPNIYGRVIQHEIWLNQGVQNTDTPTFGALQVTGDTTIEGNLYVLGNSSIINTNITEFEYNIILLNRQETGSGVTLNQAGLEIERGSLENYRIVFNEADDTIRVGEISSTQAVATREDSPLLQGVMTWNNTEKRLDSSDTITIPITLSSTSTSAFTVNGGVIIDKSASIGDTLSILGTNSTTKSTLSLDNANETQFTTPFDLSISSRNIFIPLDSKFSFGTTTQNFYVDSVSKDFSLTTPGNVSFVLPTGKNIKIPQLSNLVLNTDYDYLGTDQFNNTVLNSTKDIYISPSAGQKVIIPVSVSLNFGDTSRQIIGGVNGDISISASNNIHLIPGNTLDVRIPTDSGIKFGGTGLQKVYSDSSDVLYVNAVSDISLTPGQKISIPNGKFITFNSDTNVSITGTAGKLILTASPVQISKLSIVSTENSSPGTSLGSLYTLGGLNAVKQIYTSESLRSRSTSAQSLLIENNNYNILNVSSNSVGNVTINAGNGQTSASLTLLSNDSTVGDNLIEFKGIFDTTNGYSIGRLDRTLRFNIPSYTTYSTVGNVPSMTVKSDINLLSISSTGPITIESTVNAINSTSAALIINGGVAIQRDLVSFGRIVQSVDSTSGLLLQDSSNIHVLRVDTVNKNVISQGKLSITNTDNVSSTVSAAMVVSGGALVYKNLSVMGTTNCYSNVNLNSNKITNLLDPTSSQDAATKNYVDLYAQGVVVKNSVSAATTTSQDLSTDFFVGSAIDGYTFQLYDRVLVKDQGTLTENGIYVVQGVATPPVRSLDYSIGSNAAGTFVFIKQGTLNKSLGFVCNSPQGSDVIGTDDITFTQFTGLGLVQAGDALSSVFNQMNVNVDDSSIEIFSDSLRVKSTIAGSGLSGGSGTQLSTNVDQSHVQKVGTLNTGVWQASVVEVPYGGTGRNRFTSGSILVGNGINGVSTNSKFFFNMTTSNLGIGLSSPIHAVHISNASMASILLHSDTDEINSSVYPAFTLQRGATKEGSVKLTRNFNDFSTGTYRDSLLINSSETLQLSTRNATRLTILTEGSIGINTTNPSSTLEVNGTFKTTLSNTFMSTIDSTSPTSGNIVIYGGLGVVKNVNIGGTMYFQNTSSSTNSSTGAVVLNGGLSINNTQNASSNTDGGALTIAGGLAVAKDFYGAGSNKLYQITVQDLVTIGSVENATSTSGALIVKGGLRLYKDIYSTGQVTLDTLVNFTTANILNTQGQLQLSVSGGTAIIINANKNSVFNADVHISSGTLASGTSSGALLVNGGVNVRSNAIINSTLTIQSTIESTTTSSGALTVEGGIASNKSINVGKDLKVNEKIRHSNNALFTKIENTSTNGSLWTYLGNTLNAYTQIDDSLELEIDIPNSSVSHAYSGTNYPTSNFVIYKGLSNDYHLFTQTPVSTIVNLQVNSSNTECSLLSEGVSTTPNGAFSGYTTGWTLHYSTIDTLPTQTRNIGSLNTGTLETRSRLPLINTLQSTGPIGIIHQLSPEEVTSSTATFQDTLPSQSGVSLYQVKLSTSANSTNDYYTGWFIKVTSGLSNNQVRKVTSYNGALRVIGLTDPWTTQGPDSSDTIELFANSMASVHYTRGSFITSYTNVQSNGNSLVTQDLLDLKTNNATCAGTLLVKGVASITSTADGTSTSGALHVTGGIRVDKNTYSRLGLGIGQNLTSKASLLHIHDDETTVRLQNTVGSHSFIDFREDNSADTFGILSKSSNLFLTASSVSQTPDLATRALTVKSNGYIGINTTTGILSPLTIVSNTLITASNTTGYLGISGGDSGTSGSTLALYSNGHSSSAGNAIINSTKTVIESGTFVIKDSTNSLSSTVGSALFYGGVSIDSSTNSTSSTQGGALTVRGGASIKRDLRIGGSIIVDGTLVVSGTNSTPSIAFSDTSNCSIVGYSGNQLVLIGTEAMLSFYVTATPITANATCEFRFGVPTRVTNFANRADLLGMCSGWSDDTELHSIFNTVCTGVTSSTTGIVKFQSNSMVPHILQIITRYTPI